MSTEGGKLVIYVNNADFKNWKGCKNGKKRSIIQPFMIETFEYLSEKFHLMPADGRIVKMGHFCISNKLKLPDQKK